MSKKILFILGIIIFFISISVNTSRAETYYQNYTDCTKIVNSPNGNSRCASVDVPVTFNFYPSYDYTINKINGILFVHYQLCSADWDAWYRCYDPGPDTYNGYVDMAVNTVGGFSLLGADGTVGSTSSDRPKTWHIGYGGSVYWDRTNSDITPYVQSAITQTYKITASSISLSLDVGGFNANGTYYPKNSYYWSNMSTSGYATIYPNNNSNSTAPSIFVR